VTGIDGILRLSNPLQPAFKRRINTTPDTEISAGNWRAGSDCLEDGDGTVTLSHR